MSSLSKDIDDGARQFLSTLLEKAAKPESDLYVSENAGVQTVCWRASRLLAYMQKAGFAIKGIDQECADLKGKDSTVYVHSIAPDMINTQYKFTFHVSRPIPSETDKEDAPQMAGVHPPQMDMIVTRAGYEFHMRNIGGIKGNDQYKQPPTVESALRTLSGFLCDALPDQALKLILSKPVAPIGP